MERVDVLINKIIEQRGRNASANDMLVTTQLLQSELMQEVKKSGNKSTSQVSVMVPNTIQFNQTTPYQDYKPQPKPETSPMPSPDPDDVPIDEPKPHPGPRPEPEPIPAPPLVEAKPWLDVVAETTPPTWPLDRVMEIPTLAHQDKVFYELNDTMMDKDASLNDKLKEEKVEMAAVLNEHPVRDLKKAISINDRHHFISELFRDDETMYERSIKTINGFNIFAEAEYWIQRELKLKIGWDANSETVRTFDQLVKRRFS